MSTNNGRSLKLLIDTNANKVVYAEANKGAVDGLILALLELPHGFVIKEITKESMVGCFGNLYGSLQSIYQTYIADHSKNKVSLLYPTMRTEMKLLGTATLPETVGNYCTRNVKETVTYNVTDDLSIVPMSSMSCITLLNKFQVRDISALVEKHVDLDVQQWFKVLNASLKSKTVLTDVFLHNKYH